MSSKFYGGNCAGELRTIVTPLCLCDDVCLLRSASENGREKNMRDAEIRIGIIGAGFARTTQIPGFKNCGGVHVVAIASGHREHAEKVAREFGIEHVESDWRALVAR